MCGSSFSLNSPFSVAVFGVLLMSVISDTSLGNAM